jgi:thiamine biosynthesis lipoprotein
MGTVVTFDVFGDDPSLSDCVEAATRILHDADEMFSLWKQESPMNQWRRGELSTLPTEIQEVLNLCQGIRDTTDGWFDPWALPGGVDPTGFVKGWAAQRACDCFTNLSISGAIVNAAGDVAAIGHDEHGERFRAAIVSPENPLEIAHTVWLDHALATSGSYLRGNHLYNPKARHWGTKVASASVTGPDLAVADALATALVCGGESVLELITAIDGYQGLVHHFDGRIQHSPDFPLVNA